MLQFIREHPGAFFAALLVHLVLIGLLMFNLDWKIKPTAGTEQAPVQAVIIDSAKVDLELEKLQAAEKRKEEEAAQRLREIEEKAKQAEAAREREQKQLEELKRKQEVETQRLKEQEAQRKQQELEQKQAEQKRLAELEAKRKLEAEAKRKAEAEAKQQAEAKRKAEEEAKRKAEAEAKRKAEAEAKRKAEAEAQRKAAEKALQDQLAAERAALDAARNQQVVDKYGAAIRQQVMRNWIRPPSSQIGLSCVVEVRLIPGGDVASVRIVQSSGDAAFDRSVESAVYRAAPLPLPPDPALFDRFRTLTFLFKPN